MMALPASEIINDILTLWFSERVEPLWYNSTPEFDQELRDKYLDTYQAALKGELSAWEETPQGALALVVCLDQFPLNMFRNRAESFAGEAPSRQVAARAIEKGFDQSLEGAQKVFLYLPYMHSEELTDQDRVLELFSKAGLEDNLKWANHHRDIVKRFGRFPHRNAVLGRQSTPEEIAYLSSDEAFTG
ncbi:MAG: DUF924 domain-containing protein [Gammaproteobacteria bacterium]|nr:DUF924 domain-containing protein [Gammaproteobacteria bacterium]